MRVVHCVYHFLLLFVREIGQFNRRIERYFFLVYHIQKFGDEVCQTNKSLDLSAAFTTFFTDKIGCFKIPDNLSGILKLPMLSERKAEKAADKSSVLSA